MLNSQRFGAIKKLSLSTENEPNVETGVILKISVRREELFWMSGGALGGSSPASPRSSHIQHVTKVGQSIEGCLLRNCFQSAMSQWYLVVHSWWHPLASLKSEGPNSEFSPSQDTFIWVDGNLIILLAFGAPSEEHNKWPFINCLIDETGLHRQWIFSLPAPLSVTSEAHGFAPCITEYYALIGPRKAAHLRRTGRSCARVARWRSRISLPQDAIRLAVNFSIPQFTWGQEKPAV